MSKFKKFLENYDVTVLNDTGRYRRDTVPSFFQDPKRANYIKKEFGSPENSETLYVIQIPESSLNNLIEIENRFFKGYEHGKGQLDLFNCMIEKERLENDLREQHSSVKKAYEQYSMLLNMVNQNKTNT